ncbi:MAG: MBL fold metallo-hydrolase [Chloroflexi bacterium]|nr:MBL fold metallo-hydrolase [Chloroflexota bacterium]
MSVLPRLKPAEVGDGVFQLSSLGARVAAIEHDGDVMLVDTGARGSFPLVAKSLASLGLSTDRVRSVVLTHSHPDHAGALATVVARTGATVGVHDDDADVLETHDDVGSLFPLLPARFNRKLSRSMYDGPVTPSDRFVEDVTLDWPDPVQLIHTPGHTPGSVSLYLPAIKMIMVGDALQYRFNRLAGPARLVTHDYAQALRSLHRLVELDFETMVFSHFQPMKRNAKQRLVRLIERLEARKE